MLSVVSLFKNRCILCMCEHEHQHLRRPQGSDPLELELQAVVSSPVLVLGTELSPSAAALESGWKFHGTRPAKKLG